MAHTTPNQQARAVAVHPNGDVAVGHNDGKLTIRTCDNLANVKATKNDAKEWI